MLFNWRKIPHPTYGNYGGAYNKCKHQIGGYCPIPIDWMDTGFKNHDTALDVAKKYSNKKLRKKHSKDADKVLGKALRCGDPKELKCKIYGRVYLKGAKIIFRP